MCKIGHFFEGRVCLSKEKGKNRRPEADVPVVMGHLSPEAKEPQTAEGRRLDCYISIL